MTTLKAAMIEASMALANWQKYNTDPADETVYQAEKVAQTCAALISAMQKHERTDALVKRLRSVAEDWRRPSLRQVEGPNDLKIYGGAIADSFDEAADALVALCGVSADHAELIEQARARANALPKEIADRENEADSHCGSYGTATAEDFMDDPDALLLHDLADALMGKI